MTIPDRWAFDDLEVRIDRDSDGSYRTVATAPNGQTARAVFQLPVTDDELDDFVRRVGLVRRARGGAQERLSAIKELGSSLFDAVFTDQVATIYTSARAAASDGERRLRITLRLSGAPELMRLPWEFLYHRPRFLAQSTETPVVRMLDVVSGRRAHKVELPLRILGVISSPSGYQHLDAASERRNMETALEPLKQGGLVELSWLDRATLSDLAERVSEGDEIHVIHYIGHGAYSEQTESGILVLETPEGRADDVGGEVIGAMLQDERSLRLVVLNSCDGARTSHIDPFSGVATSLIEFDIPAVVGMQFEITDDAAIAFSASLYAGLARGLPIDAAVAPARRAIMAKATAEFGTPVLFLRDGDARLFDIDNESLLAATDVEPVDTPQPAPATVDPATVPRSASQPVVPRRVEEPASPPVVVPDKRPFKTRPILWNIAYALAAVGASTGGWILIATPLLATGTFVIGIGLAPIVGSTAAGITGVRHTIIGVLLPLFSYLLLLVPSVFGLYLYGGQGTLFLLALGAVQILLIGVARKVTSRPRDDSKHGKGTPASGVGA